MTTFNIKKNKRSRVNTIRIATWNVRGLNRVGKQQLICEEMDMLNVNILGLSETFLEEAQYNLRPTIKGNKTFTIYTAGRLKNGRRGVGFLVNKDIEVLDLHIENEDVMGILVGNKIIIQIYAPDGSSSKSRLREFYHSVKECIKKLGGKNREVIIMGD